MKLIKVVYVYRDPRDILISAIDHGKRSLESGENSPFEEFVEFEDALLFVKKRINIFKTYYGNRNVLMVRYEDLVFNESNTTKRICKYLKINLSEEKIISVLSKYDSNNPDFDREIINFNKGEIGRYKRVLTKNQLNQINQEIGKGIKFMGYSLDE